GFSLTETFHGKSPLHTIQHNPKLKEALLAREYIKPVDLADIKFGNNCHGMIYEIQSFSKQKVQEGMFKVAQSEDWLRVFIEEPEKTLFQARGMFEGIVQSILDSGHIAFDNQYLSDNQRQEIFELKKKIKENKAKEEDISQLRERFDNKNNLGDRRKNFEWLIEKEKETQLEEINKSFNESLLNIPEALSQQFKKDQLSKSLEELPELKNYRDKIERTLKSKKSSYGAGAIAAATTAVISKLLLKDLPSNPADALVKGFVAEAITVAAGASIWGVGRIGYECYHQFRNPNDANIGRNFTKTMDALKTKEITVFKNDNPGLAVLEDLEREIINETKKSSPDLILMGENLIKSHELRKSLLQSAGLNNSTNELVEKSGELIGYFEKWKDIQQGRETSEGLKLLFSTTKSVIIPAFVATVAYAVTQSPATAQAASIVAVAPTVLGAAKSFINKNGGKTGGRC
ncbi:hypothetical protein SZ25_00440, partial [Candidatus Arcanobacter lacustris]